MPSVGFRMYTRHNGQWLMLKEHSMQIEMLQAHVVLSNKTVRCRSSKQMSHLTRVMVLVFSFSSGFKCVSV